MPSNAAYTATTSNNHQPTPSDSMGRNTCRSACAAMPSTAIGRPRRSLYRMATTISAAVASGVAAGDTVANSDIATAVPTGRRYNTTAAITTEAMATTRSTTRAHAGNDG